MKIENFFNITTCRNKVTGQKFIVFSILEIDLVNGISQKYNVFPTTLKKALAAKNKKYLIQLGNIVSGNLSGRVELSNYIRDYVTFNIPKFKINLRENTGYVSDFCSVITHCPTCDARWDFLFEGEVIEDICIGCNFSYRLSFGSLNPHSGHLYKLEVASSRLDDKFSFYLRQNPAQAKAFKKNFPRMTSQQEEFLTCLFYLQRNLLPELKRRVYHYIEKISAEPNTLEQCGYIIELATMIYKTSKNLKRFSVPWAPHLDASLSVFMFAANLIRHMDEYDPEMLEVSSNYVSTTNNNALLGMSDWEYRNYRALSKDFKIEFSDDGSRELIIYDIYNVLSKKDFPLLLKTKLQEALQAQEQALGLTNCVNQFPWL